MLPSQASPASSISPQVLQELQSALNNGTLRLAGPDSTSGYTKDILQNMQAGFPSTKVDTIESPHAAAINDVQQGKVDLAALGRNLTDAEKQQGLRAYILPRRKVAIIVGKDNSFTGSLTKDQFAQIFRGETTDWSAVGGPAGRIRFIDRPDNSDTRLALSQYPVFQAAPFQHGANAEQVPTDKTQDIVEKLGRDGISYAPIDQVQGNPNLRIVPLHQVMPDDPRYAFSQPTYYAFKTPCPTAGAQAFLNYAAQTPDSPKLSELYNVENCAAQVAKPAGNSNWLWGLLALLGGAGLLAWLLRGRGGGALPAAVPPVPVSREQPSRLILTPQDCRNAYAYWEVPASRLADVRQQGGEQLKLRLYDVTDGALTPETPVTEHLCRGTEHDLQVPVPRDDRDYVAELGYTTGTGRWLPVVRGAKVRVPACVPATPAEVLGTAGVATAAAAVGAVTAAVGADQKPITPAAPRMVLVPRNANDLYAYWEVPEQALAEARQKGGRDLRVRLYDVTDGVPHPSLTQEFDCSTADRDLHMTVPADQRSYRAELGYLTADHSWLPIANSTSVTMPRTVVQPHTSPAAAGGGVATAPEASATTVGAGALMARPADMGYVRAPLQRLGGSELHIEARAAKLAYVHWHLTEADKLEAHQRGGKQLVLRVYDVTDIDLDHQLPHRMLQYNCTETEENRTLVVPAGARDYLAEIGYLTDNGSWFGLVRSVHAHIPAGQG